MFKRLAGQLALAPDGRLVALPRLWLDEKKCTDRRDVLEKVPETEVAIIQMDPHRHRQRRHDLELFGAFHPEILRQNRGAVVFRHYVSDFKGDGRRKLIVFHRSLYEQCIDVNAKNI